MSWGNCEHVSWLSSRKHCHAKLGMMVHALGNPYPDILTACPLTIGLVSRHPIWHDTDGDCHASHVSSDVVALSAGLCDETLSSAIIPQWLIKTCSYESHEHIALYAACSPQAPRQLTRRATPIQLVAERVFYPKQFGLFSPYIQQNGLYGPVPGGESRGVPRP